MPDNEETTTSPGQDSPDPSSESAEPTGSTATEVAGSPKHELPDDFEAQMDNFLGDIDPSVPDEIESGTEVPTEDKVTPEEAAEPETQAPAGFTGRIKVHGEELDVNLSAEELTERIQKGFDWDHKDTAHETALETALQAERDKFAETQISPERQAQIDKREEIAEVTTHLYRTNPEFRAEYDAARENPSQAMIDAIDRVRARRSEVPEGQRPKTQTELNTERLNKLDADREQSRETQEAMDGIINMVADYKQNNPTLTDARIKQIARFAVERGYPMEDAHLMLKGRGPDPSVKAEAEKIAEGVANNPKIPKFPAGSGSAPGAIAPPAKGTDKAAVRQSHINRVTAEFGNDLTDAFDDAFTIKK